MLFSEVRFLDGRQDWITEDLDRLFNVLPQPCGGYGTAIFCREPSGPYVRKTPHKPQSQRNKRDCKTREMKNFWESVRSIMTGDESVYISYLSLDHSKLTSVPSALEFDPHQFDE